MSTSVSLRVCFCVLFVPTMHFLETGESTNIWVTKGVYDLASNTLGAPSHCSFDLPANIRYAACLLYHDIHTVYLLFGGESTEQVFRQNQI